MKKEITVQAPGKLILSGEYAVLYGQPALAMAVNRFAEIILTKTTKQNYIKFCLPNLNYATSISLQQLGELKLRIQNEYAKFLSNECTIDKVLQKPFELLQYTFVHVLDKLKVTLSQGLEVNIHSNIPISSGMGSSAAVIMGITYALANLLGDKVQLADYLKFARDIESLQHGCSSGLDLYMSLNGGCARFENGTGIFRNVSEIPMYLINTGSVAMTTGQCISKVAKHFQNNSSLAHDFGVITDDFDKALQNNNLLDVQECIRANHRLLIRIGVVPERVQRLILEIENVGAAGKICGAGSCEGQNAGVVLVVTETDVTSIVKKYGYEMFKIEGNPCGTRII